MEQNLKRKKNLAPLLIIIVALSSFIFVSMTKYCFASAMVFIVDEGYMTAFETGLINSAFWLTYAVSQFVGGMLADKFRPEPLITFGLLSAGIINGVIYFTYDNYILTLILWALAALAQFGVWPSVFKLITTLFSGRAETAGLTVATMVTPTATLLSYLVVAIIPRWQLNFVFSSFSLFFMVILWEITRRCNSKFLDTVNFSKAEKIQTENTESNKKGPRIFLLSGVALLSSIGFIRSLIAYMPSLMPSVINTTYAGLDPSVSTAMSLLPMLSSVGAPLFSGFISKYVKNEIRFALILFSLMLPMGALTLLLGRVSHWIIIGAMVFIAFLSTSSSLFTSLLISSKFKKWGKGATMAGLFNSVAAIGNVVSSALMTFLADNGGWTLSFIALFVLILISVIILIVELPIWTNFKKKYYTEEN